VNITSADPRAALRKLAQLWQQEKLATRRQEQELRDAIPFAARVQRGVALRNLRYENTEDAGAGRCQLWFHLEHEGDLEEARVHVGDPVVLWSGGHSARQSGVVGRRGQTRLSIVVAHDYAPFVEAGAVNLDLEAPEVTFERGAAAIDRFIAAEELAPLRELLFGNAEPSFGPLPEVNFRDERLNDSQQGAVRLALRAEQVALIHGPPGTGKTRTLVEIVRQQLLLGRSVLVTAASNTAVDHLTRQLVAQRVKPLRLGHPTRVADDLKALTAETQMLATEEYRLAQKWQAEARALRDKHQTQKTKKSTGKGRAAPKRDWLSEANRLNADARRALKTARAKVLRRSKVVCTTAAGADSSVLGDLEFDVVVLDEATQAVDPVALAALQRGKIAILAGDPQQLSPTVVDPEAAKGGLGTTLFERAQLRWPPEATHLLQVQYRMHAALMRFPSESMYGGRLVADASVAERRLEELPDVQPDAARSGPWALVDTAGSGWDEQVESETLSTFNPQHAVRTAAEVQRLILRGVQPRDIAAIAPYGAQVRLLRKLLAPALLQGLEIGTVDGFQGREKEAVVVDLVRSNSSGTLGFVADVRRTNVALTRAKRFLVVIADGSTLGEHEYYRSLLVAAERDGAWESWAQEETQMPEGGAP
jgi:ATP-dependent RNA/DNA helicase IGHMBP2